MQNLGVGKADGLLLALPMGELAKIFDFCLRGLPSPPPAEAPLPKGEARAGDYRQVMPGDCHGSASLAMTMGVRVVVGADPYEDTKNVGAVIDRP